MNSLFNTTLTLPPLTVATARWGLGLLAAAMAAWALRVLGWQDPGTGPLQAATPPTTPWTAVLRMAHAESSDRR